MVILRGFAGCAGLIPSCPKHEECRHLIVVHNELPRCEDWGFITLERAREIVQEFDLAKIEDGKEWSSRQTSAPLVQFISLIAAAATVSQAECCPFTGMPSTRGCDELVPCRLFRSYPDPVRRTINATNFPEVIFQCLLNASDFLPP